MFSVVESSPPSVQDVALGAYREFDVREEEFFAFLDKELDKIENFYKLKENEATERLKVLRDQLHEMRDRRIAELVAIQQAKQREQERARTAKGLHRVEEDIGNVKSHTVSSGLKWLRPIEYAVGIGQPAKSKKQEQFGSPSTPLPIEKPGQRHESWRDFTRRPTHNDEVPYRTAKRKLKLALQEYYRGLELLKSYALLNRTAFRKINKKYDKVINARPTGRYVSEKVNKAWFVQSEVLDGHIVAVEDLYARYFEKGNHKIAVGKLRVKQMRADHYNSSVFRNGLLLAAGVILGLQGIVYGTEHLGDPNPTVALNTSYLLQVCC
jgi:SPX domain protein involved in polyphosphate accumulation